MRERDNGTVNERKLIGLCGGGCGRKHKLRGAWETSGETENNR